MLQAGARRPRSCNDERRHIAEFLEAFAAGIGSARGGTLSRSRTRRRITKSAPFEGCGIRRARPTNPSGPPASPAMVRGVVRFAMRRKRFILCPRRSATRRVFGPNNFRSLTTVRGGDFAAAIAAHNPVIAKANTAHPAPTWLLAEIALNALKATGLPLATVQNVVSRPRRRRVSNWWRIRWSVRDRIHGQQECRLETPKRRQILRASRSI